MWREILGAEAEMDRAEKSSMLQLPAAWWPPFSLPQISRKIVWNGPWISCRVSALYAECLRFNPWHLHVRLGDIAARNLGRATANQWRWCWTRWTSDLTFSKAAFYQTTFGGKLFRVKWYKPGCSQSAFPNGSQEFYSLKVWIWLLLPTNCQDASSSRRGTSTNPSSNLSVPPCSLISSLLPLSLAVESFKKHF